MNEYRCTRNDPYQNPNCPGFKNPAGRCGQYIDAPSPESAIAQMKRRYPGDTLGFTADFWKARV